MGIEQEKEHRFEEKEIASPVSKTTSEPKATESEAWKQKPEIEKSKDEEFDEYFEGLFL